MIEQNDLTVLDGRYVLKTDCKNTVTAQAEEITELKIISAKIGTKLNVIIGILGAIGVALLGAVVDLIIK